MRFSIFFFLFVPHINSVNQGMPLHIWLGIRDGLSAVLAVHYSQILTHYYISECGFNWIYDTIY